VRDDEQTLRDDVAFLRALAEGGASGAAKDGAILMAVGLIFGLVAAQYWAIDAALFQVAPGVHTWLWLDGAVPFLIAVAMISARFRGQPPGAASRALTATWIGVGAAHLAAGVALYAASKALGIPLLVKWVFPLVLFTLIGGAWGVVFAVRRRAVFGVSAAGAFAAAILTGAVMGRPEEWLVLAAGLIFLLAAPGGLILATAGSRR
jgi:hypothetical protein